MDILNIHEILVYLCYWQDISGFKYLKIVIMKIEDLQKIFDSISNNPTETIILIVILIIIFIVGVYIKSYLSEKARKAVSDNGAEK